MRMRGLYVRLTAEELEDVADEQVCAMYAAARDNAAKAAERRAHIRELDRRLGRRNGGRK